MDKASLPRPSLSLSLIHPEWSEEGHKLKACAMIITSGATWFDLGDVVSTTSMAHQPLTHPRTRTSGFDPLIITTLLLCHLETSTAETREKDSDGAAWLWVRQAIFDAQGK